MIIVKSIKEKPKECRDCRLLCEVTYDCAINPESIEYTTLEGQYEHCPIEEAPDINVGSMDAISRRQALETTRTMQTYKLFSGDDMVLVDKAEVQTNLMMLPSAHPERPTGEWIQKPRYEDYEYPDAQPNLKCPFCGYEIGWCDMGNYCARCGADLKGGAE